MGGSFGRRRVYPVSERGDFQSGCGTGICGKDFEQGKFRGPGEAFPGFHGPGSGFERVAGEKRARGSQQQLTAEEADFGAETFHLVGEVDDVADSRHVDLAFDAKVFETAEEMDGFGIEKVTVDFGIEGGRDDSVAAVNENGVSGSIEDFRGDFDGINRVGMGFVRLEGGRWLFLIHRVVSFNGRLVAAGSGKRVGGFPKVLFPRRKFRGEVGR